MCLFKQILHFVQNDIFGALSGLRNRWDGNSGIRWRWTGMIAFCAALYLFPASARAQVSKEYQIKAVLLLRLAQFTQWPHDAFDSPDSPLIICVAGENLFGGALQAALRGETSHGRAIVPRQPATVDQIKECHMLFLSIAGPRQTKEIMEALSGRSVLTVADGNDLPNAFEAMVRFVTEQSKIKLIVNPKAAAARGIVFDPRLLRAVEIVGQG